MSGTDKLCTWFNKPWLDFTGRPMEQEVGHGWAENIHPDDYDRCLKIYTVAFDARQSFSMEYRLKRQDGDYRWLLDNGVPLYGPDGDFTGYIGSCIDITERRQLERDVVKTASQEQRRIGQDLHDSVAQELTALNMLARDLAETVRTDATKASQLVEQMKKGLQRSQQELRAVLRGLLPVAVDSEGLMAALADLAARTQHEGKVSCVFDCAEPVAVGDNLTATQLFLIAQEAVYNAVKHGQAQTIRIALKTEGGLDLSVQDDGVGMPPSSEETRGLGLRIMRNRAAIIGAALSIEPAQPTGTLVSCVLGRRAHERA
jgi:PAS domain S-box-containing protein